MKRKHQPNGSFNHMEGRGNQFRHKKFHKRNKKFFKPRQMFYDQPGPVLDGAAYDTLTLLSNTPAVEQLCRDPEVEIVDESCVYAFPFKKQFSRGKTNPVGRDGQVMKCSICNSTEHLRNVCPNKTQQSNASHGQHSGQANQFSHLVEQVQQSTHPNAAYGTASGLYRNFFVSTFTEDTPNAPDAVGPAAGDAEWTEASWTLTSTDGMPGTSEISMSRDEMPFMSQSIDELFAPRPGQIYNTNVFRQWHCLRF